MAMPEKNSYVFSQQPQPVSNRQKFREPILDFSRSNIMSDPRVVRGNTYAALVRPDSEESDMSRGASAMSTRFRARRSRKRVAKVASAQFYAENIPSHEFLEELTGPISTHTAIDPDDIQEGDDEQVPFVPKPSGHDKGTFVEDTDLFDFDISVVPILEVLVGKGLEQGMLEVLGEEDIRVLEMRRTTWEQHRDAVHVEAQRLLTEKQRRNEEKERRLQQAEDKSIHDRVAERRWGARNAAKEYMDDARDTVLERLQASGHFYDPVQNQIVMSFIPWVLRKVGAQLKETESCQKKTEELVDRAIVKLLEQKAERARQVKEAKEAAERERQRLADEKAELEAEMQRAKEAEQAAKLAAMAGTLAYPFNNAVRA